MRGASRALYRSRQFFTSLRPHVDERLREQAFELMNDRERDVFSTMTARDQQHCLDVFKHLRASGHDDHDLLVAALLHDAGKGRIALRHRVAYVVLDAAVPVFLRRMVQRSDGDGWRQALYRCLHHPRLGGELARDAGSSEQVVALIREEDFGDGREHLDALRAADEAV